MAGQGGGDAFHDYLDMVESYDGGAPARVWAESFQQVSGAAGWDDATVEMEVRSPRRRWPKRPKVRFLLPVEDKEELHVEVAALHVVDVADDMVRSAEGQELMTAHVDLLDCGGGFEDAVCEVETDSGGGPDLVSDGCYGSSEEEDYFDCGSSEFSDGCADSFEEEHGGWAGGGQVGSWASLAYLGSYKCITYLAARGQWDTVPELECTALGPVLVPGKAAVAFETDKEASEMGTLVGCEETCLIGKAGQLERMVGFPLYMLFDPGGNLRSVSVAQAT
jgi:hypothetical protein